MKYRKAAQSHALRQPPCYDTLHQREKESFSWIQVDRSLRTLENGNTSEKITEVIVSDGQRGTRDREFRCNLINLRLEFGHGAQVWVSRYPNVLIQGDHALSSASFGRSGTSRAPSPKRKIAAAIRPTEIPHSKIEG